MGFSAWESQRGWVFARQSLYSFGQLARDWARGQLCLAVIRHSPLSLAFPHRPPPPPRLVPTHSHAAIQYPPMCMRVHVHTHRRGQTHTLCLSSSLLFIYCPLSFSSSPLSHLLSLAAAMLPSSLSIVSSVQRQIQEITLLLPWSDPKLQGEEQN